MCKAKTIVGVDVSKDTIDVYVSSHGHDQFSNDVEGFRALVKFVSDKGACYVMESTGVYHQRLAGYLYGRGLSVAVLNPLIIKRFIQMKLHRVKTDKSDSKMIAQFGMEQSFELWQPDPEYIKESKLLFSSIEIYQRQGTMLKNKLHSLDRMGIKKGNVLASLKRQLKHLKEEVNSLETALEQLIRDNEQELYTHLLSIPGIGKKTAILLIASTNGFKDFESAKQVSSFFGLSPTERSSGSSIRGRSRINKAGNVKVRSHLFLCSFTACQCNPQCMALYERLVGKGKSKKLALIAVTNKLIKQAFAISKSGLIYDPAFGSKLNHNS